MDDHDGTVSKKQENVMPLELAIKRETAYQMRVLNLPWNPHIDIRQQPSAFSQPLSVSSTTLVGKKRTSRNDLVLPNQAFHRSEPIQRQSERQFCKLCKVFCPGIISFKQHLSGKKHAASVEIMDNKKRSKEEAERNALDKWDKMEWEDVV